MKHKRVLLLILPLFIGMVMAYPLCLDSNSQDISNIPCQGFTVVISCSGNITAYNSTDSSLNYSIVTSPFAGGVYNFTLNLTEGEYELIDCENNSATVYIGLVEQGYGINLISLMIPAIILSFVGLFFSGRIFRRMKDEDDEEGERKIQDNDGDSFVPNNRLIPIVLMLFSFIPMIFMVGLVNNHLEEYLSLSNLTAAYGSFYILFSIIFYFTMLFSIIVWLSSFIQSKRIIRGLDEY